MPSTVLLTDSSSAVTLDTTENYYLAEGVTHYLTTSGEIISFTGTGQNDLFVNGSIVHLGIGEAIESSPAISDVTITISASGSIFGNSAARAITLSGDDALIINHGAIVAGEPVILSGDDSEVFNTGTINSNFASNGFQTYGINFNGVGAVLTNSGMIETPRGIEVQEDIRLTNSGTISTNGNAIQFVSATGAASHIINTGVISSSTGSAIAGQFTVQVVHNSGEIIGDIGLLGGDDVLTNTGTITGDITFTTGVNEITNAGLIVGHVTMGSADDTYHGSGAGTVTGTIDLAGGDDTAVMGDGGGEVLGGTGNDTIRGGTGSDQIDGGSDNDDIRGRGGADILEGGSGDDTVRAGQGDDVLDGGSGNDFMRGGAGEDIIIGGLGQDTMFGNGGADTFVFNAAAESTNAGAAWDRIMDFTQGEDLIDLSVFNARFIGTGAYAANGNIAEVRIFEDPNGDTRVFVDVNADGVSDMRFYLVNVTGVTADDFIL